MAKKKEIELPSDLQTVAILVNFLEGMERSIANPAIFDGIDPREKEAFLISLNRTTICARNIQRSLK